MFISQQFIDELVKRATSEEKPHIIGQSVSYFALFDNDQGVTGVEAVVTRVVVGQEPNGPFIVDLALPTSVEDIFYVLRDLTVVSLKMVSRTDDSPLNMPTACLASDADKIREIIDAPRFEDGLKVVVDNTKQ